MQKGGLRAALFVGEGRNDGPKSGPWAAEPPRSGPAVVSSPTVISGIHGRNGRRSEHAAWTGNVAPQRAASGLPFTPMQALAVLLGLFLAPSPASRCSTTIRWAASRRDGSCCASRRRRARRRQASRARKPRPQPNRHPPRRPSKRPSPSSMGRAASARMSCSAAMPRTSPTAMARAARDGRHRSAPAREIALRHDPGGRRWAEALHRLCGRGRPRQGRQMPVVAIVVGGLGVGAAKTTDAIMKLPPA